MFKMQLIVLLFLIFHISIAFSANESASVIKLTNCPPDHVLRPCRCTKFSIQYMKPDLLQTILLRLPEYEQQNVHIVCSSNEPHLDLSDVMLRIRNFYSKEPEDPHMSTPEYVRKPLLRSDNYYAETDPVNHTIEELVHEWNTALSSSGDHVQMFGFVSNSVPYLDYEWQLHKVRFEFIDVSYTNLKQLSFVDRSSNATFESVKTLILAYNQLENEENEDDDDLTHRAHLATSALACDLSRFTKLEVLSLRGNRLRHFHLPVTHLRVLHHQGISSTPENDEPKYNYEHSYPHHRYGNDENRLLDYRRHERIVKEVRPLFYHLRFLDLAENHIKILPPNAYNSLPHLSHLNLEANGLHYVYANAFRFPERTHKPNTTELIQRNAKEIVMQSLRRLQIVVDGEEVEYNITQRPATRRLGRKSSSSRRAKANRQKTALMSGWKNYPAKQSIGQLNLYLGRNRLNCSKINRMAFSACSVPMHLNLELNEFEYICEDNFGEMLLDPNVLSVNFRKNPIKCTHCENKWLFVARSPEVPLEDNQDDKDFFTITQEGPESEHDRNNSSIGLAIAPPRTKIHLSNARPLKYDLSKLIDVKCSLKHDNVLTWSETSPQVHLMDFSLTSFGHCALRKRQLIEALKHYALFLRAFSVLPQSSLERIDEILQE